MTRILGVDPGSNCTGYALVVEQGGNVRYVDSGHIRPARPRYLDPQQVGGIVERGQRDLPADGGHHAVVDQRRLPELLAAVHDPMADSEQVAHLDLALG